MNREPLEQEVGAQLMASHRRPDHKGDGYTGSERLSKRPGTAVYLPA
jgi:hypothetical protein